MQRRGISWSKVLLITAVLWSAACGEVEETPTDKPDIFVDVTSLDGRLQVSLPQEILVHRHQTSIQATAADGTLRYFIGYEEGQKLARAIGSAKGIVTKHRWKVEAEKHFTQASELRLERTRPGSEVNEKRTIWFIPAAGGVVVCDGIATASKGAALEEPFRKLCTRIHLRGDGPSDAPQPGAVGEDTSASR